MQVNCWALGNSTPGGATGSIIGMCRGRSACSSKDAQYVRSVSWTFEQLHRVHGICTPGSTRHVHQLSPTAADINTSQQQPDPDLKQMAPEATFTPLVDGRVPTVSPMPLDLMSSIAPLAAGAAPAVVPAAPSHSTDSHHSSNNGLNISPGISLVRNTGRSQRMSFQRQQSVQLTQLEQTAPPAQLQRPQLSGNALRQLLQQDIQSASSWQQLAQLLAGRRESLTLKHLSLMMVQAVHIQAEVQRLRLQQLRKQYRRQQQQQQHSGGSTSSQPRTINSNSSSSWAAPTDSPPKDVLSGTDSGAAAATPAEFQHFVQQLAELVQVQIGSDPGLAALLCQTEATPAAATANAATATSSSSSSSSSRGSHRHRPDLLAQCLANILWGFAKLNHTPSEQQLLFWVQAFTAVCSSADAVSFSQVFWALGQLQCWPGEDTLDALAAELARRMNAAAAAAADADAADAVAAVHHAAAEEPINCSSSSSEPSRSPAEGRAVEAVADKQLLGSRALSNILWSFAVLGYTPSSSVLTQLWAGSVQRLRSGSPQALSNIIWAVGGLELVPSPEWMAEWEAAVLQGLQQQQQQRWKAADVANVAWALGKIASLAKFRTLQPSLPLHLAVMRAARLKEAEPRELVSIAWGLTAAGVAFSESFTNDLLLTTASNKIHFKAGEWAQLLMLLAKQGITPPPQWQRGCHAVMSSRLRFMTALDFSTCLWGIAQLGVEPRNSWKERFFSESNGQLFFLSSSNCCALVWALGRLHWRPPLEWQDRLFLETYTKLSTFSAAELTGTLHGLAALRLQPPVQWMHQATAAVGLVASDLGVQEVTSCLWALSRLRYRPSEPWIATLADRAAALLPEAWKLHAAPNNGSSSSSSGADGVAVTTTGGGSSGGMSDAEAAHWLDAQHHMDHQEASLRHKRQQLLQHLKQSEQQNPNLQQQHVGSPAQNLQQQQPHMERHRQQHQELLLKQQGGALQLRGDVHLLQTKLRAVRNKALMQQQQRAVLSASSTELLRQQQQRQQQQRLVGPGVRRMGYHDIRIVLKALSELQYTLPRDHQLLRVAEQLNVASSGGNSWTATPAVKETAATEPRTQAGYTIRSGNITRLLTQKRAMQRGVAGTSRQDTLTADTDDTFLPGVNVAEAAAAMFQDDVSDRSSTSAQQDASAAGLTGQDLLVAPAQSVVKRRRHAKRLKAS